MAKKEKYIKIKTYKNSTYYTVQFEYDSMGERKSYSKTFRTMKEAVKHRDLKRAELITNGLPSGKRTVIQLFEDHVRIGRVKLGTAQRNKKALNHVPELHNIPIDKLTPLDIQRSLNSLIYDYSDDEIRRVFTVIKTVCETAILEGHLTVSPMGRVILPKSQKIAVKRAKTASDEDIDAVMDYLDSYTSPIESSAFNRRVLYLFLRVLMYTGMRPSEALALKRDNVHIDTCTISIESRIGSDETGHGVETRLKTDSSQRTIPMSSACLEAVRELLGMSANDYLFTMYSGKLMTTNYVDVTCNLISKELGIEFHPYMLRHRAATKIIVEGKADPRTAMEILGHSSIQTTLNVYSHSNNDEKLKAIDLVEKSRKLS